VERRQARVRFPPREVSRFHVDIAQDPARDDQLVSGSDGGVQDPTAR
jgi:hypothetical protein